MNRKLFEAGSILSLIAAFLFAGIGVARGIPAAWLLFVAPSVVFGVITISQRLPVTSLNLTVKVTAENAPRIEPVARDFLASIKAYTMMLIVWLNWFVVIGRPMSLFFFIEAVLLFTIVVSVFGFIGKVGKLA